MVGKTVSVCNRAHEDGGLFSFHAALRGGIGSARMAASVAAPGSRPSKDLKCHTLPPACALCPMR